MARTRKHFAYGPNGEPRYVKIFDNGGRTFDRYTALYTRMRNGRYNYRGMSEHPFSPQGFGQWGDHERYLGFHADGKQITFDELPPDCQKCVLADYREIWGPFEGGEHV